MYFSQGIFCVTKSRWTNHIGLLCFLAAQNIDRTGKLFSSPDMFFRLPWLCRKEFLWKNITRWAGSCFSKPSWPGGGFKESDCRCSGSSGKNHGNESSVSSLSQVSVILCQMMLLLSSMYQTGGWYCLGGWDRIFRASNIWVEYRLKEVRRSYHFYSVSQ